jgi:prepilin-type N-terminal cleavage/methylation domain-containing protein
MSKRAFTLIELLVVVAIIGILSGFVIVQMNGAINAANDGKKKANLSSIKKALIVYGVENGNTYPVESGCTIGSCSTLDPALSSLLPQNLNGTYTYESDGSSFSVSSILSSGYAYSYDSVTNSFTTEEPTAGSCGSASKTYLYTETTYGSDTFCIQGTASPSSPSFPELGSSTSWTCPGSNGGATANCSASRNGTPVNGVCGTSDGQNLTEKPLTNFCTLGTASSVTGSGPWLWSCVGSNGGTDDSCATGGMPVNGSCGSADGQNLSSQPLTNLCNLGNASTVSGSGPWTWDCLGVNSGTTDSCSANKIVNGSCGTANQTYAYSTTTYGSDTFCQTGTVNPATPAFPNLGSSTTWSCDGANSGTNQSCTANRNNAPVNGSCGTKNGKYASTTPTETQACLTGTITNMTGTYSWTCAGSNGGDSPSCATVAATYGVQSFTTVGTTQWTAPSEVTSVQYLVVAGGGGGGTSHSGGGGGGGVLTGTTTVTPGTQYSVIVGAGGAPYTNGNNSIFQTFTAIGGGHGGNDREDGAVGGCGGGSANRGGNGGAGTSGQGYKGGAGGTDGNGYVSGGGGGAGGAGGAGNSSTCIGGAGGTGYLSSITGTATYYAGGGGGGHSTGGSGGAAGLGGGGLKATAGTDGLGGGGGGGYYASGYVSGGKGGSGIVVIKYINNY